MASADVGILSVIAAKVGREEYLEHKWETLKSAGLAPRYQSLARKLSGAAATCDLKGPVLIAGKTPSFRLLS